MNAPACTVRACVNAYVNFRKNMNDLRIESGIDLTPEMDNIYSMMLLAFCGQRPEARAKSLELDAHEQELAKQPTMKIAAIKAYRERTFLGLKEAKDAVEAWQQKNGYGYQPPIPPHNHPQY